ncbi:MAG: ATP-binding cassette domain-containing protein [Defluviitaleaceae bacterium]|nr:ATP-binding cassette domain-containing protein [Defluviitaleaceae bacterium]
MRIKMENYFWLNKRNKKIDISWEVPGIYILKGQNGVGKTTFVEDILYGDVIDIKFNQEAFNHAYLDERFNLFSYLPQDIPEPFITVKEYLQEMECFDLNEMRALFEQFDIEKEILKRRIAQISGGERIKIFLIATISRKTPYIFLDEPTNNLDDHSVNVIAQLLKEISKSSVVVITTHDPRLTTLSDNVTMFTDVSISNKKCGNNSESKLMNSTTNFRFKTAHITMKEFFKSQHRLLIIVQAFVFTAILFSMNNFIYWNFNLADSPNAGTIMMNSGFDEKNEFNENVADYLGLTLRPNSELLTWMDIPLISEIQGVKAIIMTDFREYLYLNENIETLLDNEQILNPPQLFWEGYDLWHSFLDPRERQSGRFPQDNSREVALSLANLQTFYGFSLEEAQNSIGQTIQINHIDHEIVGILLNNFTIISHHENENFGFLTYKPDLFDEFLQRTIDTKKELNWWNNYVVDSIHIQVYEADEKNVLIALMELFPTAEFYAYHFSSAWIGYQELLITRRMHVRNILTVLPAFLLVSFVTGSVYKVSLEELKVTELKYLEKSKVKRAYHDVILLGHIMSGLMAFAISVIFFNRWTRIYPTLLMNVFVFICLNSILFRIVVNKNNKR